MSADQAHIFPLKRATMTNTVENFLYRNPQFYEIVYPEPDAQTPRMCRRMFERFLPQPPRSILDIGCGTARDLDVLSGTCADCWGVDYLQTMIEYARAQRPHLTLRVGDMRSVRLGRTFDAILCMGSAFTYALTDADIEDTLETFAAHAHPGTLLILDLNNAAGYLADGCFAPTIEFRVQASGFSAVAYATNTLDRRRQRLTRRRKWTIEGRDEVNDYCEYRLFFPAELEHLLCAKHFQIRGMFDNMELKETDLAGPRLYVAASLMPGGRM